MSGFIEFLGHLGGKKVSQMSASTTATPSTKGNYFRYATERTDD